MTVLIEFFTNGFTFDSTLILSLFSIICGVAVITNNNPIVSVLFLIGLFLGISAYLMLFGYNFIGLSYLLVYVGAVSILFLFILMLINVRVSELYNENSNSIPLATSITAFFFWAFSIWLPLSRQIDTSNGVKMNDHEKLFSAMSAAWDSNLTENTHISSIGNVLYTVNPIWLILVGVVLLLSMVGSIIITIRK